jgi:hypothetical protein
MVKLSKHDVNKLSIAELVKLLPVELTSDGEVVALIQDVNIVEVKVKPNSKANYDVNKLSKASHDVNKEGIDGAKEFIRYA